MIVKLGMLHKGLNLYKIYMNDDPGLTFIQIHFLNNFKYFGDFSKYQSLRRLPLLKFSNSHYFPLDPFARFIGSLMRL